MIFNNIINLLYNIIDNFIKCIYNKIIFLPEPICKKKHKVLHNSPNYISEKIVSSHKIVLDACLYNTYSVPSYKDIIFLYNHSNTDTIQSVIDTNTIRYLSKYGSVFIYDYRGYGLSKGYPTEYGIYDDVLAVWNFLITKKNISEKNIILFGDSLGCSVASYLMYYLLKNNRYMPKTLILQNTFLSINCLFNEWVPYSGSVITPMFNTSYYIKSIDILTKKINIYFIYTKQDKLINMRHGIKLYNFIKNNLRNIICVPILHNNVIYNTDTNTMMTIICREYLNKINDNNLYKNI